MRIEEAQWEERNLGVTAVEVTVTEEDTTAALEDLYDSVYEYAVVKVPAASVEVRFALEDRGFHLIEVMIGLQHNLKRLDSVLDPISKRISDSVSYSEMSATDLEELWAELAKGIFTTDRVALDPAFSVGLAARRYKGWIGDVLARGGKAYKCGFKGKAVGFFVNGPITDGSCAGILSGTYKDYERSGLGVALIHCALLAAKDEGAKRMTSGVSTNNLSSLRANLQNGWSVAGATYIYVKHNSLQHEVFVGSLTGK
jgi:GNAT superfamily N-acetyltransferase